MISHYVIFAVTSCVVLVMTRAAIFNRGYEGEKADPPPGPPEIKLTFCDFEHIENGTDTGCGFVLGVRGYYNFSIGQGKQKSTSGPLNDHTMGSTSGHYAYLNPADVAQRTLSYDRPNGYHAVWMESPVFEPSPGACVRVWYNMYGSDVDDFNVLIRVGSGIGYPVVHAYGNQGHDWILGEADLDTEFTGRPFQVLINATTDAYYFRYSSGNTYPRRFDSIIAVDDIAVFHVRCKDVPKCPDNGHVRQQGNYTYCYTFHTKRMSWYNASSFCRQQGAHSGLVAINSKEEQGFLVNAIKADSVLSAVGTYGFFTAGNDESNEHHFVWTDTGNPYSGSYWNWKTNQPNNVGGNQDCVVMEYPSLNYQWGDEDCDQPRAFICETWYPTPGANPDHVIG